MAGVKVVTMVALMWVMVLPVLVVVGAHEVTGVLCPGGELRCPDHMTCCLLANKRYGCCPFPNAVCCQDHVHCCPSNMVCDTVHQACLKKGFPVTFFWQVRVHPELVEVAEEPAVRDPPTHLVTNHIEDLVIGGTVEETVCPDGRRCPGSYTCCKMYRGDYGCCPYSQAQCCSDGFHCCPTGSKCDITSGGCHNAITNMTTVNAARLTVGKRPAQRLTEFPTRFREESVRDPGGKCPDGHPCPEKLTCCKVQDGGYGCCPYSNARCCTDLIHCCPHGTNCNTTTGTCDVQRSTWSVPAYSLLTNKLTAEVRRTETEVARSEPNVMCPDRQSECPDGNTCCRMKGGKYGCCPMPDATCCQDLLHCCPRGYKCSSAGCYKEEEGHLIQHSFVNAPVSEFQEETQEDQETPTEDVVCPDHQSRCPDGNTCCEVDETNTWGCCPMSRATCCGDKKHCCPHGYWCSEDSCERVLGVRTEHMRRTLLTNSTVTIDTLVRSPHIEEETQEDKGPQAEDVVCPDHHSRCPNGNTCCEIDEISAWGCCPMPRATCCSDKEHCCPHGYQCSGDSCERVSGVGEETVNRALLTNSTMSTSTPLRSHSIQVLLP